jgi:hypothetical protein
VTDGKSPFDQLLEDVTNPGSKSFDEVTNTGTQSKTNFKFDSLLKSNNQRQSKRVNATGFVIIYNEVGEVLTKAVLRNVSATGIAAEMYPVSIKTGSDVLVEISSVTSNLGRIKCKVLWIEPIEDHPKNHKMIGLNIVEGETENKKKFEAFVKTLYVGKS